MIRFRERASIPEKMDDPNLSQEALQLALSDIRRVNRLLGGHAASLEGFRSLLSENPDGVLRVVDMGCGDGEFLRCFADHCRRTGREVELLGWDMNPKSLEMAREASRQYPEVRYECRNVLRDSNLPDQSIVICNLFLHHFSTPQIEDLLLRWKESGAIAVIINDLHRNALAYYLFRLFGAIFMKSPVARYDGAVSIRRGFVKSELKSVLSRTKSLEHSIRWRWAFRWLCFVRYKKNSYDTDTDSDGATSVA